MSTRHPVRRDSRYVPSPPTRPRPPDPEPSPDDVRRWHLAAHGTCQWQSRAVRCVAEAVDVVVSREGVLRSSCEQHVPAWLRAGAHSSP